MTTRLSLGKLYMILRTYSVIELTLEILVTPGCLEAFPSKSFEESSYLIWLCSVIMHLCGFHKASR